MTCEIPDDATQRRRVLWLSTATFTLLFAVWLMFGVLGVPIQKELGLTDVQLAWLGAAAILAGSLPRFLFGVWTDLYGGRLVIMGYFPRGAVLETPTWLFTEEIVVTGNRSARRQDVADAVALIRDGRIKPVIGKIFSLRDAAEAHRAFEAGEMPVELDGFSL